MTPISPQDRSKVILLVVAIAAVFGFLIWRTMSSAGPSPAASNEVHLDTPPATTNAAAQPSPSEGTIVSVMVPASQKGSGPFRKILGEAKASLGPATGSRRSDRGSMAGSLSGSTVGPVILPGAKDIPTEEPKLSGVMSGNPPLGVFVIGGKDEILRVGDTTSTGFRVLSIQGETATLVKKSTRIKLSISP